MIPEQYACGIPLQKNIDRAYATLYKIKKEEIAEFIHTIISKRGRNDEEKNIFSTYKETTYYINLARQKFALFDEKMQLSKVGKTLLSSRKCYQCSISTKEERIYFKCLLKCDAHFFIPFCSIQKYTQSIGKIKEIIFPYLKEKYNVTHFDYTTSSYNNYLVVRSSWLALLKVLNKNYNIKISFKRIIQSNIEFNSIYNDSVAYFKYITTQLSRYEKDKYLFLYNYRKMSRTEATVDGFVSLYKLMYAMHKSFKLMQVFLNLFFEKEHRGNYFIITSDIIASIDWKKRFTIGNAPALLIKIIKKS